MIDEPNHPIDEPNETAEGRTAGSGLGQSETAPSSAPAEGETAPHEPNVQTEAPGEASQPPVAAGDEKPGTSVAAQTAPSGGQAESAELSAEPEAPATPGDVAATETPAEVGTAEPRGDAKAEQPPAEEVAEQPPAEEAAEQPPAEEVAEQPPAEEVAEQPPAEEAAEQPPAEEVAEQPPAEEAAEQPPAEEVAEQPPAEEAAEQPPAEEVAEQPPAEEVAEQPPAEEAAEQPPAGSQAKESTMEPATVGESASATELEEPSADAEREPEADKSDDMDWYILKVQSNREESIREGLMRRVKVAGLEPYFGQIIVPTEQVVEFKGGKKRVTKRKLYPGYLVVQMEINDETWFLVRETPGIGDFTGAAGHPTPMQPHEVTRIVAKHEEKEDVAPKPTSPFSVGDRVKIKEGTFENFEGEVSSIDESNLRVEVMINIFGRSTPVELGWWQIESAG